MKKMKKLVCLLMVAMIFASVASVEAWADNNVWQMMENGETWVDENGHTWMPAPEPDGESVNATGTVTYDWTVPADTAYYSAYKWHMQSKQKIKIKVLNASGTTLATGIQGYSSYKYRMVFGPNDSYAFPIHVTDDYRAYIDNFQTSAILITMMVTPIYEVEE